MSFLWPSLLYSLLLIPVFVWFYVRLEKRRKKAAAVLGSFGMLQDSFGGTPRLRRHISPILFLLGLSFLLLGLARPEMPLALPRVEGTVVLAFDVSKYPA